jgi:hypothetical protein
MRFCNYITGTASVPWNVLLGNDGESDREARVRFPQSVSFCHRFQNSIFKNKALQAVTGGKYGLISWL